MEAAKPLIIPILVQLQDLVVRNGTGIAEVVNPSRMVYRPHMLGQAMSVPHQLSMARLGSQMAARQAVRHDCPDSKHAKSDVLEL